MDTRRFYAIVGVVLALISCWLVWDYFQITEPVAGIPCATTTAEAAAAEGLNFNHTIASMRDPANGVLVVAAIGQPFIQCAMVLSSFRCEQEGPATVRARAGPQIGYFKIPEGETAIILADGDGAMSCTIPTETNGPTEADG
jgi:hypothetical protein